MKFRDVEKQKEKRKKNKKRGLKENNRFKGRKEFRPFSERIDPFGKKKKGKDW